MALRDEEAAELARLDRLAEWLDAKYETPVGLRVGWDGILGLVPIVGQIVTTAVSAYLVARAAMLGASVSVLLRMGFNILLDDAIALVPFLGWVGDFFWKSNLRNTELLRRHLLDPAGTRRRSTAVVVGAVALVAAAFLLVSFVVGFLAWKIGTWAYSLLTY